jgi:TolB protein
MTIMSSRPRPLARILTGILFLLILLNLVFLVISFYPAIQSGKVPLLADLPSPTSVPPTLTPSPSPTMHLVETQTTPLPTLMPVAASDQEGLRNSGIMIIAFKDATNSHLFAYNPLYLQLTRLTNDPWDEESPAINPDGSQLAFTSRRNGYWNIYTLDLATMKLRQLTDTAEYDGAPTWSPDNNWISYETYLQGNLEIMVKSLADPNADPIQLTDDSSSNTSPAWSPGGREIAFVSTRSGNADIWLAKLDVVDDRFRDISNNQDTVENHPAWSPDGRFLAWDSQSDGNSRVMIWDSQNPDVPAVSLCMGTNPVWSPDGKVIMVEIQESNQTSLTGYSVADHEMVYPITRLPGSPFGIDWKAGKLPDLYSAYPLPENAHDPAGTLWNAALSVKPLPPNGRFGIVELPGITAPFPYLNDDVDESFNNLRHQVGIEVGWDFLSSLENAYFPLTEPPNPGSALNWLLTGRAIAVNPVPAQAGWLVTVKEDYGGQTYWRIFLKARYQDGSEGKPMVVQPWDINARYLGNPKAFENGGQLAAIPPGYWVDFTEIANRYGWERLESLPDWRSYYPAMRFNQFVLTDGLDWQQAMAEVYPPEALLTSTALPSRTPTQTETVTPGGPVHTVTPTKTVTQTPTLNPTLTPVP